MKEMQAIETSQTTTVAPAVHSRQLEAQLSGSMSFSSQMSKEDEEMSRTTLSAFRAKEEEIEKKTMEIRERVQAQLGCVKEETKRLALIREDSVIVSKENLENLEHCSTLHMASIVMLIRALMSCRLTPKDEPTTRPTEALSSAITIYRNVSGDKTSKSISEVEKLHFNNKHDFAMGATREIKDMEDEFYWIVVENRMLM